MIIVVIMMVITRVAPGRGLQRVRYNVTHLAFTLTMHSLSLLPQYSLFACLSLQDWWCYAGLCGFGAGARTCD